MKTTILQLENHDNLISIRDRMDWAKTPRILLVWPSSGRIQLQLVQLNLIKRHASGLGAQVGLVARRGDVRREAQALQIPIYKTLADAQRQVWPEQHLDVVEIPLGRRNVRRIRAGLPQDPFAKLLVWQRLTVFSLGVLALFVVVAAFLPAAVIQIERPTQRQSVVLPVIAAEQFSSVSLSGEIPVEKFLITVQGNDSIKASGQMQVPAQSAQVSVILQNLTDSDLTIPAGTILISSTSPQVRFSILKAVSASAGESAEVLAQAVNAGAAGNVSENSIVGFEGPLGLQFLVVNAEPATGGTDLTRPAASDSDREKLAQTLQNKLLQQAREQLQSQLKTGDVFISDSIMITQIKDEIFSPLTGQPGTDLHLSMEIEVQALVVSVKSLEALAILNMDASLPAGYFPVDGSLRLEPATSMFTNMEGITRWQLSASRRLEKQISVSDVISLILGKPTNQAAILLEKSLELENAPFIGMTPAGWPWLPWLPIRIEVVFQ